MPFDLHGNLAISTVAVAPLPATSGTTLAVAPGHGARFPAPPFNATVWDALALPSPETAEVVRVTAIVGDQLTIVRAAEPPAPARAIAIGDLIAATITAKALTDIESGTNFPQLVTPGPVQGATVTGTTSVTAPLGQFGGLGTTPLNASQLLSGTVPDARLSPNVLRHAGGYPGGTATFLRADGVFQAVPINGGVPGLHAPTHATGGTDPVNLLGLAGYPGGTTLFLRADGTFALPPGGGGVPLHAATHIPGGGDTIPNVAWTNVANTFTQTQTVNALLLVNNTIGATVSANTDAVPLQLANPNTGTQATVVLQLSANIATANIRLCSNLLTPVGVNHPGALIVQAQNGGVSLVAGSATHGIRFHTAVAAIERGLMHPSGGFSWGSTVDPGDKNLGLSGDLQFQSAANTGTIRAQTLDGSDNHRIVLCGGGAAAQGRGAVAVLHGNESTLPGAVQLVPGDVPGGNIYFYGAGAALAGVMHRSGGLSWGSATDPALGPVIFVGTGTMAAGQAFALLRPTFSTFSAPTTALTAVVQFVNPNGEVGAILTGGTTTTFATTSDARLKTALGRHADLSVLRDTVIHDFAWKADGTPGRGVFAQEAADVAPFAVKVGTDETDADGRLTSPWGVDYSKYVPDLIAGWQQHERIIAELLARLGQPGA